MTTRDAAKHFGVSIRTIYKRIRKGELSAKKVNRRWVIQLARIVEWPLWVYQRFAIKDGLNPSDFDFLQWPVSKVMLTIRDHKWPIVYSCEMPNSTPVDNQYIPKKDRKPGVAYEDAGSGYLKIPDPVGLCLQSVQFDLIQVRTLRVLHHQAGLKLANTELVCGGPTTHKCDLWEILIPGKSINVQLRVFPKFYFLGEDGGMKGQYSNQSDGHFDGNTVNSPVYNLHMDQDGNITMTEVQT